MNGKVWIKITLNKFCCTWFWNFLSNFFGLTLCLVDICLKSCANNIDPYQSAYLCNLIRIYNTWSEITLHKYKSNKCSLDHTAWIRIPIWIITPGKWNTNHIHGGKSGFGSVRLIKTTITSHVSPVILHWASRSEWERIVKRLQFVLYSTVSRNSGIYPQIEILLNGNNKVNVTPQYLSSI